MSNRITGRIVVILSHMYFKDKWTKFKDKYSGSALNTVKETVQITTSPLY